MGALCGGGRDQHPVHCFFNTELSGARKGSMLSSYQQSGALGPLWALVSPVCRQETPQTDDRRQSGRSRLSIIQPVHILILPTPSSVSVIGSCLGLGFAMRCGAQAALPSVLFLRAPAPPATRTSFQVSQIVGKRGWTLPARPPGGPAATGGESQRTTGRLVDPWCEAE